jgi:hypothetical protein
MSVATNKNFSTIFTRSCEYGGLLETVKLVYYTN